MAENTRGQSNGQKKRKLFPSGESQKTNLGNERQRSTNSGRPDMDSGSSIGRRANTRGLGMAMKRDFRSCEFDGQLSDE